jgi:hypothetical protein
VVKIIDDDNTDIFGTGLTIADGTTVVADFDDGVDNIKFINKTVFSGETIAADSHKDFYFNVQVERPLDSHDQIQPFHFEVFQDNGAGGGTAGNGIKDGGELNQSLTKFSWLSDSAHRGRRHRYYSRYSHRRLSRYKQPIHHQSGNCFYRSKIKHSRGR